MHLKKKLSGPKFIQPQKPLGVFLFFFLIHLPTEVLKASSLDFLHHIHDSRPFFP